jgi:hypothetical protein
MRFTLRLGPPLSRSRPLPSLAAMLVLATMGQTAGGCSSAPPDVHATFEGIIAGSSSSGPLTGSMTVKVDGATAMGSLAFATSGSTNASTTPPTKLVGSAHGSSYAMQSVDGFQMAGSVSGSKTKGTLTGPGQVSAKFSGEDISHGTVTLYCGTYSGTDSGIWNFAVGASGDLSGAFAGAVLGDLSGSGTTQSLSLTWSASDPLAGNLSGTAQGSLSGTTVTGSWQGSGQSGTFMSNQSCPGAPPLDTGDAGSGSMGADDASTIVMDSGGTTCAASGSVCANPTSCCSGQCYTQSGGTSYCY